MSGVFGRIGVKSNPVNVKSVFQVNQTSSLPAIKPEVINDNDIDTIGESVSKEIGETTQKIIDKMVVGKFDDLGVILTSITNEVDKLDPASIQKSGVVGWFQKNFSDIKSKLMLRLKSAQDIFKGLEDKIAQHITVQQEWVRDLESLYTENYTHYRKIVEEISKVDDMIQYSQSSIDNWPDIDLNDPDVAMKVQAKRDAELKIQRLARKKDNLMRLKAMTETNSPKIRQQQETSRNTISVLRDIVSQTIPIVKMEFATFLQTLDVQKSVQLTAEVRELSTKALTRGADGAKLTAVESTKALNTPVITTETLQYIRGKMLETVMEVNKVNEEMTSKREADSQLISEGQKSLLKAMQESGKIY